MLINLLDKNSIQLAIDKLKKMGSTKNGKSAQGKGYIVSLLKDGTKYMRSIMPQDTGYLRETTDYDESTGKILVDAYYAAFVEYGTGIVGATSPHEHAGKWQYDASGYGKSGWYYRNKETRVAGFTRGQPASAFLLKTAQYLKKLGGDQIKVKTGIENKEQLIYSKFFQKLHSLFHLYCNYNLELSTNSLQIHLKF